MRPKKETTGTRIPVHVGERTWRMFSHSSNESPSAGSAEERMPTAMAGTSAIDRVMATRTHGAT